MEPQAKLDAKGGGGGAGAAAEARTHGGGGGSRKKTKRSKKSKSLCKNFKTGRCTYGDKCRYKHDGGTTRAAAAATARATARTARIIKIICTSAFLSVLQHVIQLQAEPLLIKKLCAAASAAAMKITTNQIKTTTDPVSSAAKIMANTSGIVGILGLVINQLGGNLSDALGRQFFWYVGPIASIICGECVQKNDCF